MNPTTAAKTANYPALRSMLDYLDGLRGLADLDVLAGLLRDRAITRDDLAPACIFKPDRYQRNTIRETKWYELVCLCWSSGQRTPIHDHEGSSCAFLVVEGTATETRFDRTESGLICPSWTKHHLPGYVCASSAADVHRVANTQPKGEDLITLHVYSPKLVGYNIYTLDTPK